MSDLHELTGVEQVTALRRRELSSRELTLHYLDRIERHGQPLGAFISVFADEAVQAAELADSSTPEGPLHGLPLALKDLHPTAGMRTTMGSAALADWVPEQDATIVGELRAAGAVIVGKTNAPEFGPVCYTETTVGGDAQTPYAVGYSASGSSGGAAAAVAAGLTPVGHASDGLGSIRLPAATCGLVGFKPSRGRTASSVPEWLGLAVEGPVARTVADAALLLDALSAPSAGELWRGEHWTAGAHTRALTRTPKRLRIGRTADPGCDVTVDSECLRAWEEASKALAVLGHHVEDVPIDPALRIQDQLPALLCVIAGRVDAAAATLIPPARHHELMPFTRWLLSQARQYSATDLTSALNQLARGAVHWRQQHRAFDLLLTPTTTLPPQPVGALRLDDGPESLQAMLRYAAFTPWVNLTGLPAVSLPVHTTPDGLPIGVQLIGGPDADELLLAVAAQMEKLHQWQDRHPPHWLS